MATAPATAPHRLANIALVAPSLVVPSEALLLQRAVAEYGGQRGKVNVKAGITAKIREVLPAINITKAQQIAAAYQQGLSSEAEVNEILNGLGNSFNDLTRAPDKLHEFKESPNRVLRLVRGHVNGARWGYEDKPKTLESLNDLMTASERVAGALTLTWREGKKEIKNQQATTTSWFASLDANVFDGQWAAVHIHYKDNQNRQKAQIHQIHLKPSHQSNTRLIIANDAVITAAQTVVDGHQDGDFANWNNYIMPP